MKIIMTNRQRAELASLCAHRDLQLSDIGELRVYNRVRRDLDLYPIIQIVTNPQGPGMKEETFGDPTPYQFTIDTQGASLLLRRIAPFVLASAGLILLLGEVLEDLDGGGSSGTAAAPPVQVWEADRTATPPTYEGLRAFLGLAEGAHPADVLARAEALCAVLPPPV